MPHAQNAAAEAAAAVDKVLDQLPAPGAEANPVDVLLANVKLHAAEQAGASPQDVQAHQRRR